MKITKITNKRILACCAGSLGTQATMAEFRRCGYEVIPADCKQIPGGVVVPFGADKDFLPAIERIAAERGPLYVCPHNHNEAYALALAGGCGENWQALVSPACYFDNTHNKANLYRLLGKDSAPSFLHRGRPLDAILADRIYKPVMGCGAGGIMRASNDEYIETEILQGDEYTIDAVVLHGAVVDWCARRRIGAHGGICIEAKVEGRKPELAAPLGNFVQFFGLSGPFALQGFLCLDGKFRWTDCNHRFGGGVAFSILAGWRGVENYLRLLAGEEPIQDYEIGTCHARRWYREEVLGDGLL